MTLIDLFKNRASDKAFLTEPEVRTVYWRALGERDVWGHEWGEQNCIKCHTPKRVNPFDDYAPAMEPCPVPDPIPPLLEAVEELRQKITMDYWDKLYGAVERLWGKTVSFPVSVLHFIAWQAKPIDRFIAFLAALTEDV